MTFLSVVLIAAFVGWGCYEAGRDRGRDGE